jgi:hypothetical protein
VLIWPPSKQNQAQKSLITAKIKAQQWLPKPK